MITIKLPIQINEDNKIRILNYQKQYSNLLHIYFNRLLDGYTQTQCKHLKLNNIELLDSWFKQSCIYEAMSLNKRNKDKKVIFGGRKLFHSRSLNNISKEEFKLKRLNPIYSIGEGSNPGVKGNRKFFIKNNNTIIFKPSRKENIELKIKISGKYKRYLELLIQHQDLRDLSITYRLSINFIQISFDENILKDEFKQFKPIKNRIISIDMNPNYIGWSIIDWINSEKFNIIDKGVLSIKNINNRSELLFKDKTSSNDLRKIKLTNKRNFEVLQCSKFLIQKMKHYKCNLFVIEDLNIKSNDKELGKKFNRLCNNNWCRTKLVNNITKWCSIYNIQLIKVKPEYSSFIGNIVYRSLKLPDMVLSSIEISRRGYQFYHQYIAKDKQIQKNIIIITLTDQIKKLICQSLEELSINNLKWNSLFDLYRSLKKTKCKYRFPLKQESFQSNSLKFQLII